MSATRQIIGIVGVAMTLAGCATSAPTSAIPADCAVHGVPLKPSDVRIKYGIGFSDWDYGADEAALFPHSDKPVAGGCTPGKAFERKLVCPQCAAARQAWVLKKKVALGIYQKTPAGTYLQLKEDPYP
jgi:hypothetical protein